MPAGANFVSTPKFLNPNILRFLLNLRSSNGNCSVRRVDRFTCASRAGVGRTFIMQEEALRER